MGKSKKNVEFSADAIQRGQDEFKASLEGESDRGVVLICLAYMDEKLELLLRSYFKFEKSAQGYPTSTQEFNKAIGGLFGTYMPLYTFLPKLHLAYLLGLLSEWEFDAIETANQIRNKFAHQIKSAKFGDPNIADLLERFLNTTENPHVKFVEKASHIAMLLMVRAGICEVDGDIEMRKKLLSISLQDSLKLENMPLSS